MHFSLSRGWPFFLFFSVRQVFKSKAGFTYHLTQSKKCSNFGDDAEEAGAEGPPSKDDAATTSSRPQFGSVGKSMRGRQFKVQRGALVDSGSDAEGNGSEDFGEADVSLAAAEDEAEEAEAEEDENEVVAEQPQSEEKPQMACPHCFKVPTCALNQFCPGNLSVFLLFFRFFIRFAVLY